MNRILSRVDRFWWNTCGITIAVLVASRGLRYAANALPSPLEELTGHLLAFQFRASITAAATLPFQGVACALVLLILLIRPRWLVTSLWGVAAINLESGAIVARRRTEFGPRLPLIDATRDLIFVTPTFGSHVWALDRRTLDVVEKLPSGAGGRNGHLSSDGRYLFVGGGGHHVAWRLD